ncbi:MAG: hypothetical protein ACRC5M_03475 [Anaeroplasmataceae bacterium]
MRIKKSVVAKLKGEIEKHGYWSKEVFEINNQNLDVYGNKDALRIEQTAKLWIESGMYKLVK